MKINWAENRRQNVHQLAESLGNLFVEAFHYLALGAIVGIYFKIIPAVTNILCFWQPRTETSTPTGFWYA